MNRFQIKENKRLREKYYFATLDSGLKITVIPKPYSNKFAFVCCDFGNADLTYEKNGEVYTLPAGTAHFLEHKMFETASGSDAFLEFDRFGGSANAFTSFENTCYYFSCTENLNVLLSSVSSAHFTDESVEREKSIIAREITMYEDSPAANVTRNLSKALYHTHPIIHPIAGSIDSISGITKETLFRAFNDFYVPQNMSLCVCGDIDPEQIYDAAYEYFGKSSSPRPKTLYPNEPQAVSLEKIEKTATVASDVYAIGIKCDSIDKYDLDAFRKATAMRIAISLTFGRASDFYCENYALGLLNERFYAGVTQSRDVSYIIISGSGNNPLTVMEKAKAEISARKSIFFTDEQILREKRAAFAESLTLFDSGEDLAAASASCAFLEYDEFDCIDVLSDVTSEEIKSALDSIDLTKISISIVGNGKERN